MNKAREIFLTLTGCAGSAVVWLFGGWDSGLATLLVFMGIDYVTGLITAAVFRNSPKSKSGGLESGAGLKGLLKKGMMLTIVLVAVRLDAVTGSDFIRDSAIIAFIVNETISIIENAGLMGVPIPKVITKAIDVLKSEDMKNR